MALLTEVVNVNGVPRPVSVPADHKPSSAAPCAKCGAFKVRCTLEDESDGCGTYYDIECEACGDSYRTDGPDA